MRSIIVVSSVLFVCGLLIGRLWSAIQADDTIRFGGMNYKIVNSYKDYKLLRMDFSGAGFKLQYGNQGDISFSIESLKSSKKSTQSALENLRAKASQIGDMALVKTETNIGTMYSIGQISELLPGRYQATMVIPIEQHEYPIAIHVTLKMKSKTSMSDAAKRIQKKVDNIFDDNAKWPYMYE